MKPSEPQPPSNDDSFAALFGRSGGTEGRSRRFSIGDELEVMVVKVSGDSVFVDLDGKREGFIELTEMVDAKGNPIPITPGARVLARVVEFGGKAGAVRLCPVALKPAGTEQPSEGDDGSSTTAVLVGSKPSLVVGVRVRGTVSKVESFGVFLQIAEANPQENRGLIPLAELNIPKGSDPRKHFAAGQTVEAKVVAIDERKRVRLSIRACLADAEKELFHEYVAKTKEERGPSRAGFGTLGDLLSKGKKAKK